MSRKLMWAVLVIGVAMIVAPFAMGLPGKTASGEEMIDAFKPIMTDESISVTKDYYENVFAPLGEVAPAMNQQTVDTFNGYLAGIGAMAGEAQQLGPAFAQATGMDEAQVQEYMGQQFPAMSQMLQGLPQMQEDFTGLLGLMGNNVETFQRVPPGLEHYKPLVDTMIEQQSNFQDVASLPPFGSFTWFFVIPGVLLVLIAAAALIADRRKTPATES